MECACGQQSLWINPVVETVDNSEKMSERAMSLLKDKSFNSREAVTALLDAVEILAARVDSLELQVIELLGVVEAPLTYEERIERIREIREGMGGASTV